MPIAAVNGTDLFYLEVGAGLPCLVMHGGLGLDHTYLHPALDPLGDRLRLVYYDQRGNGRSGRPPLSTLTFEQFAADADALRAALELDRVAVLGHSYGGFIALEYALRYPRRVSRLVLLNTAPAWDFEEEIRANALRKGATPEMLAAIEIGKLDDERAQRRAFQLTAPLYYATFDLEAAQRLFRRTQFSIGAALRGEELQRQYDTVARLDRIRVPTLIATGRDDFITPPSQSERLHKGIRGSELVIFERSGHFPFVEEPEAFFSAVRGWLARAG
ncbi:MAG: alpha/beta fold hydrolase [Nitrospirota bacterium]